MDIVKMHRIKSKLKAINLEESAVEQVAVDFHGDRNNGWSQCLKRM